MRHVVVQELPALGEDMMPHLASQSDSCALVKGPRAGASCEDAGPIPSFTAPLPAPFPPSPSTCSVWGPVLHQRWMRTWGPEWNSLGPEASPDFPRLGSRWQEPDSSKKGQKIKKWKRKERGLRGREAEIPASPLKGRESRTARAIRKVRR